MQITGLWCDGTSRPHTHVEYPGRAHYTGWNIERSGMLTWVCRRPGVGFIDIAPLEPTWDNNPPPAEPRLYRVSFSKAAWFIGSPVESWTGRRNNLTYLHIHFVHRHVQDTILILEEYNLPQHHFLVWNMIVPWEPLKRLQYTTSLWVRGEERKTQRLVDEESQSG